MVVTPGGAAVAAAAGDSGAPLATRDIAVQCLPGAGPGNTQQQQYSEQDITVLRRAGEKLGKGLRDAQETLRPDQLRP